jgi:hypothetical protein
VPANLHHPVLMTVALVSALGGVFLKGFKEAIWLAVLLVAAFLAVNVTVIGWELVRLIEHPEALGEWRVHVTAGGSHPAMMVLLALALFPKLALGLSGFETGVAVMPLVRGDGPDADAVLRSRIANTRRLLATAAGIMSVLLVTSVIVTATMIPEAALAPGGEADGRALAYLAHRDFGPWFGTAYDLATIGTLWFAGASALAGLLNLVPQYLPRYGMAPDWARATRPLVVIFTAICILVTVLFEADVNQQAGAYATGVLMLMSSSAMAVAIALPARRGRYALITLVFLYTVGVTIVRQPEGIQIAAWFIVTIIASSLFCFVLI